jgi:hypothetical protein
MNQKAISNLRILLISFVALLIFSMNGEAQCKEYIIGVKGDTLNCKDAKGLKQGRWVNRTEEVRGEPGFEEEGEYRNDKKEGAWRVYTLQGDLMGIENYRWGNKHGLQQYFNTMGDLVKEESWLAQNPNNPTEMVEVYDINDPKKVYLVEVKMEGSTVPHGIWKVFEPGTGKVLKKENFILGKLDDGTGTANGILKKEQGSDAGSTTVKKEEKKEKPKPKEVADYEKKNSGKKKIKVRTGETGG